MQTKSISPSRLFAMVFFIFVSACSQMPKEPALTEAELAQIELTKLEASEFEQAYKVHASGDVVQAKLLYMDMLSRFPNNVAARVNLAHIAISEGDYEAASMQLDQALAVDATNVQANTVAGVVDRQAGRFDEAEAHYRAALEGDAEYLPAILNLAILLDLYRGRLAEALNLYERALSIDESAEPRLNDWIFDIKRRIGDA